MAGMELKLEVKGAEELQRKLSQPMQGFIKSASRQAAGDILVAFQNYPPETIANRSSQRRWYERFFGPRWHRRDGSVGGRRTSEKLGQKWKLESSGAMNARITNTASYAGWVHGDKQTKAMRRIGWKTYHDVMTVRMVSKVNNMFRGAVEWWIKSNSL
jgi:hypothetical protein